MDDYLCQTCFCRVATGDVPAHDRWHRQQKAEHERLLKVFNKLCNSL